MCKIKDEMLGIENQDTRPTQEQINSWYNYKSNKEIYLESQEENENN